MLSKSMSGRSVVVFALMALVVWSVGLSATNAQGEELKIGVIAPLSGPPVGWGYAVLHGTELAADEVNAKGGLEVGGKKYTIKVIGYDSLYTGQGGVTAANRLIFEDKVKFIVGPLSSSALLAVQPISEPEKVMLLCNTYTSKALSKDKPYTFRVMPTSQEFSGPMIKWIAKQHPDAKTVAILSPNDETGAEVQRHNIEGYKEAGIEVAFTEFYERETKDFFPILTRILAKGVGIIDADGSAPGTAGLIIKQARQLGFKGILMKTGGPGTPEIMRVAGSAAEGFYYYTPIADDDPVMKNFEKHYGTKYRNPMNALTPYFFDGTRMLFKALVQAGTVTDTGAVSNKLVNITDFEGLLGKVNWRGEKTYGVKRQIITPYFVGQVQNGKEKTMVKLVEE